MALTVYAALVDGLKPSTRGHQLRGKQTRVVFTTAPSVEKALNKIRGRNQGFEVVRYEVVEH